MAEQVTPLLKLVGHINHYQDGNLDAREVIVDCLADLMHFASAEELSFDDAVNSATNHYIIERREG